jgi:3-oxoacyl-[acyl-carrier-protein] synthase III
MKIEAIAHALPRCTVSNEEMTERVLTESKRHLTAHELLQVKRMLGAFFRTAGTRVRYFRADDESAWSLTTAAGTQALERAGRRPEEIDLLIYAGVGRGFLEPSTATVFHDLLGLQAATCFDVLDACAGWLRAMHVAQAHLRSGDYRRVMILTGEFNVREYGRFEIRSLGEIRHLFPTYTISEAATATILSRGDEADDWHFSFRNWHRARALCMIPLPNIAQYSGPETPEDAETLEFFSHARELIQSASIHLVDHYREDPRLALVRPDIIFGHAASDAVDDVMEACNLDPKLYFRSHGRWGNTVSSSVPLALDDAITSGQLREGHQVLIGVASAGLVTAWTRFSYRR